jgi:hypothetical protein
MIDAVKQKRQALVRFQQRHSAARPRRAQWLRMSGGTGSYQIR